MTNGGGKMNQLLSRILGPNLGHSLIISPADKVIMATDNSPSRQGHRKLF
jgi:hypothetical protein